jgi:hypothetical protein
MSLEGLISTGLATSQMQIHDRRVARPDDLQVFGSYESVVSFRIVQ